MNNTRQGFFEHNQFVALRRHLPATLQPVITFAYITGWRTLSEILTLEWRQVDLKAKTVRLEPGMAKNKEGRVFPYANLLELGDLLTHSGNTRSRFSGKREALCRGSFIVPADRLRNFERPGTMPVG